MGNNNFGLKLALEGEREFKAALRDINLNFRVLGSEMALITSSFEKNDKSIEALTARKQVLNREIDTQKDKITTLEAALQNASDSFGENDKRTQNWQIQLNNAKAELNGMERELKSTDQTLNEVAQTLDDTGDNTEGLAKEVENAGNIAEDAESKFSGLGSTLKTVGATIVTTMAAIGTAAIGAGKALFYIASATAEKAEKLDNTATKLGLSRQGLQEWDYILNQSGASVYNLS